MLEAVEESRGDRSDSPYDGLWLDRVSFNVKSPPVTSPRPKKSWLPTRECQFKCCHSCRPSSFERSFLSLDAVVNGELPATAITGFRFEHFKSRPMSLVKHVHKIGLRPNPTRRSVGFLHISYNGPSPCKTAIGGL